MGHHSSRSGGSSSSRGHSKHGGSKHETGDWKRPIDRTEYFWFCCQCGDGPGTNMVDKCVICNALRCPDCPVEGAKIRGYDSSGGGGPAGLSYCNHPSSLAGRTSWTLPMVFSTPRETKEVSHRNDLDTKSTKANEEKGKSTEIYTTASASTSLPLARKDSVERDILMVNPTLSSKPSPATDPSECSSRSSSIFTDEAGSTSSRTDAEQDDDGSGDDDTSLTTEEQLKNTTMQTLGACILVACSHKLAVAAHIIPQINAAVQSWTYNGSQTHATAAGSGSEGNPVANEGGRFFTSGPSGSGYMGSSGKRAHGADDMGASGRAGRRQRMSVDLEIPQNNPTTTLPTFACHFCKKDPTKYNFQFSQKYKNCPHPKVPANDLRRIKDHFTKNHLISQCNRCYTIFENNVALVEHQQLPEVCEKRPSTLKEGIDIGQWEKVVHILKKTTQKGRQEFDKWYDIWDVLFPGILHPQTPWNESGTCPQNPAHDTEAIMDEIISGVQTSIEQEIIPRNDQLYQHIFNIVRRALEMPSTIGTSPATIHATTELEPIHILNSFGRIAPNELPLLDERPGIQLTSHNTVPRSFSSENRIEFLASTLPARLYPRSSNLEFGATDNGTLDTQGPGWDFWQEIRNNLNEQNLNNDASRAWDLPIFEAPEDHGNTLESRILSTIPEEPTTELSAILEEELRQPDFTTPFTNHGV